MMNNVKEKMRELKNRAMTFAKKHKNSKVAYFLYGLVLGYVIGLF